MQAKLITPTEVAARMSISVRQVLDLARRGEIPGAVRINARVIRFDDRKLQVPSKG